MPAKQAVVPCPQVRTASAAPTRKTPAFEHESAIFLEQHSSTDHTGPASLLFLHRELFAKRAEEELEPRVAALIAESPFQGALVEEPGILVERELGGSDELGEDLLAEEEVMLHDGLLDAPSEEEAEEPAAPPLSSGTEPERGSEFEEPREQDGERRRL